MTRFLLLPNWFLPLFTLINGFCTFQAQQRWNKINSPVLPNYNTNDHENVNFTAVFKFISMHFVAVTAAADWMPISWNFFRALYCLFFTRSSCANQKEKKLFINWRWLARLLLFLWISRLIVDATFFLLHEIGSNWIECNSFFSIVINFGKCISMCKLSWVNNDTNCERFGASFRVISTRGELSVV